MKRLLVALLVSLVLLTTSAIGCGQVYWKADLDAARQAAGEAGYSEGYASGKVEGYDAGHDKGYEDGKVDGYSAGIGTGKAQGYDTGKAKGYEDGFLEGNKAGYAEGYDAGIIELESVIQEAEILSYDKGYEAGIAAAEQTARDVAEAEREAAEAARQAAMARLDDLAYIEIWGVSNYSDDANPAPNGISLRIRFYDSKSRLITFTDTPLSVAIKIYDLGDFGAISPTGRRLIYEDTITKDFTGGIMGPEIRIPFEDMKRREVPSKTIYGDYYWSRVETQVTVTTPNQGDFSVTKTGSVNFW